MRQKVNEILNNPMSTRAKLLVGFLALALVYPAWLLGDALGKTFFAAVIESIR